MSDIEPLLNRLDALLDRIEGIIPAPPQGIDAFDGGAYHWQFGEQQTVFHKIKQASPIRLTDLHCIDHQKQQLVQNTRQFLAKLPANHVLLSGPKGTGKSSLIKALLNEYQHTGLNLIEIEQQHLPKLRILINQLADHPEQRFILYCDDLSFSADDMNYKAIKVALDGTLTDLPEHILLYASSNRRHLTPELMSDNVASQNVEGELHLNEAIEEKIALSERFGIWLALHPFNQDQYLQIVNHWLTQLKVPLGNDKTEAIVKTAALKWALEHGSRSGRIAWQFAKDWVGQQRLQNL